MDNIKSNSKTAIIIGAGPAGLTAAIEMLRRTDIKPIIVEEADVVGGISRTVEYNGNRMDIGGHRFFSKDESIMNWWAQILPLQAKPAFDDILLGLEKNYPSSGPDPETDNKVMLIRRRISRIFYRKKFFNYPVTLSADAISKMGIITTMKCGLGFLMAKICPRQENSLEDFYINRFGKPLYSMFFKNYTHKVWGKEPKELDADWGAQRVNGLSLASIIKNLLRRKNNSINQEGVEKSLIEQFIYPKYGPGQLWECVADEVKRLGGIILMNTRASAINCTDKNVVSVTTTQSNGTVQTIDCDYLLSSMPIKDLVGSFSGIEVPQNVTNIASHLPYRDFITVGILVNELAIGNRSKYVSFNNRIPDTWIYIQEDSVRLGRLQIFNNWSPYMVADYKKTMWIGLEYFCNEGDDLWSMSEADFKRFAIDELVKIGYIANAGDVLDAHVEKVKKAYPAYFGSYHQLPEVVDWINGINNLFCIGRNGQHRYNNMDQSMMTAIEAVNCLASGSTDKSTVWNVNTEQEYHEQKS